MENIIKSIDESIKNIFILLPPKIKKTSDLYYRLTGEIEGLKAAKQIILKNEGGASVNLGLLEEESAYLRQEIETFEESKAYYKKIAQESFNRIYILEGKLENLLYDLNPNN